MFRYAVLLSCAVSTVSIISMTHAAAAPYAAPVEGDAMTNEDVIKLVMASIPEDLILQRIKTAIPDFDTSSDGLIALSTVGVPKKLIAEMMLRTSAYAKSTGTSTRASTGTRGRVAELSSDSMDPMVPHVPGIYAVNASGFTGKMRRIEPVYAEVKGGSGGGGGGLLGGLGGIAKAGLSMSGGGGLPFGGGPGGITLGGGGSSGDARIRGSNAAIRTNQRSPVFYIYFDESVPEELRTPVPTVWADGGGAVVSTPEDLHLIQLEAKKGYREGRFGGKVKEKDQIHFTGELISPGIYRVTVRSYLQPGQYGLILPMRSNDGRGIDAAKVFDFEVH